MLRFGVAYWKNKLWSSFDLGQKKDKLSVHNG
jgi:hypothetical protein